MKVIDLLNEIAKGDISEDTLIEFDNGYKDYCSIRVFFDRYIMDRENLNTEIEIIEDKKIEHLLNGVDFENLKDNEKFDYLYEMETRIINYLEENK